MHYLLSNNMNDIERKLKQIESNIDGGMLNRAIRDLRDVAQQSGDYESLNRLNAASQSYGYLRRYYMEGKPDPTRASMLSDLAEQLRSVSDALARRSKAEEPGVYYSSQRLLSLRKGNLNASLTRYRELMAQMALAGMVQNVSVDMSRERYELLETIFLTTMLTFQDKVAMQTLRKVMENPDTDIALQYQLIAALTLGMAAWFDEMKLNLMIELLLHSGLPASSRARLLAGVVIGIAAWPERIAKTDRLKDRIKLLLDADDMAARVKTVIKAIAGTLDTQRISDKMKNEVLPEIMKLRPEMIQKLKGMSKGIDPESLENNPEWEEMLDKTGIGRKLEELSEMQNDGADLMMVTFSQLKGFPFFQRVNNWFMPFDSKHPDLGFDEKMSETIGRMTDFTPFICDSDKYSLALALKQAPEMQRNMLLKQFDMQFEQMSQELKEKLPDTSRPDFDNESVKAVRDLYRFYKLSRKDGDFYNPFAKALEFLNIPGLDRHLNDGRFIETMAEFYFKRQYYKESLGLFRTLSEMNYEDNSIWQKIGFACQKLQDFAGAREAYMKSVLLGDDSLWIEKKLAFVNRRLGNYSEALEYYDKVLARDSENVKLMITAGNAALMADKPAQAAGYFYHAHYLRPDMKEATRGAAWAELMSGHIEKADTLYNELLEKESEMTDLLNAGHVSHLSGRIEEAVSRYRSAARMNKSDFELAYVADIPVLQKLGVDPQGVRLILDEVMDQLES